MGGNWRTPLAKNKLGGNQEGVVTSNNLINGWVGAYAYTLGRISNQTNTM